MSEPGADEAGWLAAADGMDLMMAGWRMLNPRTLGCFFLACAEAVLREQRAAERLSAAVPIVWAVVNGERPAESVRPMVGFVAEIVRLDQLVHETGNPDPTFIRAQSDTAIAAGFLAEALVGFLAEAPGRTSTWWTRRERLDDLSPWQIATIESFEIPRERIVADHFQHLRDIAGNPFKRVRFAPEWRTEAVVALARGMYEARDFAAMAVLANALDDAGCDHPDVLDHCRTPGLHVRGCWVVDLVLGMT